jgi:hypothetical protein
LGTQSFMDGTVGPRLKYDRVSGQDGVARI